MINTCDKISIAGIIIFLLVVVIISSCVLHGEPINEGIKK